MKWLNIDYENLQVVINGILIAITLIKWVSPLLVGCIGFYGYRKISQSINKKKENKEHKDQEVVNTPSNNEVMQKRNHVNYRKNVNFNNNCELLRQLENYEEPEDKSKYSSLSLEFGKDGKVKQ